MTEIREAPRELLALVTAMREDWSAEETWTAILACKTAGREWKLIVTRLVAIAVRDDTPPSHPRELWDDVRGVLDRREPGSLDPEARAKVLADIQAATDSRNRATGPQARLTATSELELLHESYDP